MWEALPWCLLYRLTAGNFSCVGAAGLRAHAGAGIDRAVELRQLSADGRVRGDGVAATFDVLLTGIWQPDASGWSFPTELAKRGEWPTRFITTIAMSMHQEGALSQTMGCRAYLVRPSPLSALEAALK